MFKVTNRTSSPLSVDGHNVPPNGSIEIQELTPMVEYLKQRSAVAIDRVQATIPAPIPVLTPAVIIPERAPVKPKTDKPKTSTEES